MGQVRSVRSRGAALVLVALAAAAAAACGSSSSGGGAAMPPPDPVAMALMAPGVRTVVVPPQDNELRIAVPTCETAGAIDPEATEPPPGSNQVIVPRSASPQSIAVQPCLQGQPQATNAAGTVLLSPGGGGTASAQNATQQAGQAQNQLVLPEDSGIRTVVVPPCIVTPSSSGSSSGGSQPTALALPVTGREDTVVAPPCLATGSSSGS